MRIPRLRLAALAAISGIALSGCAYDMYGDPYGYGYGAYGGMSAGYYGGYGYGPYGGYGGYGGYGYGGYGYGYGGYDPFGWYGDYYYPGVGIYVYDRYRNRRVWDDNQRRYWGNRQTQWRSRTGSTGAAVTTQNWGGFDRSGWRNRNSGTTSGTGSWNRSNWQNRSSTTSTGQRSYGHRSHDHN
jgi:hypothetical protein